MSEETMLMDQARAFAQPNEAGEFEESDCELLRSPANLAFVAVIEQADGWRASCCADLAAGGMGGYPHANAAVFPARAEAIADACEQIVLWCADEKAITLTPKKHRKQAEALQGWALDLERRELANAVPVDAPKAMDTGCDDDALPEGFAAEAAHVIEPCDKCGGSVFVVQDGPAKGLIACPVCEASSFEVESLPAVPDETTSQSSSHPEEKEVIQQQVAADTGGVSASAAFEAPRLIALDLADSLYKMPIERLLRVTLAVILFDLGAKVRWSPNSTLAMLADAHKVNRASIAKAVDEEMNPKPAAPSGAKAAIAKLGTLAAKQSAAKKAGKAKGKGKK